MPEGAAGPAVDLRDENAQRAAYLNMLMDWNGADLTGIYEPLSVQLGWIFVVLLLGVLAYVAWTRTQQWRAEGKVRACVPISRRERA